MNISIATRCFTALSQLLLVLLFSQYSFSAHLHVAVAANFQQPLRQIATLYESQRPVSITVSTASSGKLYAQILHGAPYDVFFSADEEKIDRLIDLRLIAPKNSLIYAQGQLALYSNQRSLTPVSLSLLSQDSIRIAMANPKLAPYGAAAKHFLQTNKIQLQQSVVTGENIAQAFHYVESGNADMGFVALSQLMQERNSDQYIVLPIDSHSAILQKAGVLQRSRNSANAYDFLMFMKTPQAQKIMQNYGYIKP